MAKSIKEGGSTKRTHKLPEGEIIIPIGRNIEVKSAQSGESMVPIDYDKLAEAIMRKMQMPVIANPRGIVVEDKPQEAVRGGLNSYRMRWVGPKKERKEQKMVSGKIKVFRRWEPKTPPDFSTVYEVDEDTYNWLSNPRYHGFWETFGIGEQVLNDYMDYTKNAWAKDKVEKKERRRKQEDLERAKRIQKIMESKTGKTELISKLIEAETSDFITGEKI